MNAIPLEYDVPTPIEAEKGRCPVCGGVMDETGCRFFPPPPRMAEGRWVIEVACYVGNPALPDKGPAI